MLGLWILSGSLNLLCKRRVFEQFTRGIHYESPKFDQSCSTVTGQMDHTAVFPVLSGCMCKHICCKYFLVETEMSVAVNISVCDSKICSPLCFWPVKPDNSKVLRKQGQSETWPKCFIANLNESSISERTH